MIPFDLNAFLIAKRLNLDDFARIAACTKPAAHYMRKRGTIKPSTLRRLENLYGNCSEYISTPHTTEVA